MFRKFSFWDKSFFFLLLFHFIFNLFWIIVNNAPFPWDQAAHADIALKIAGDIKQLKLLDIFSASNYYPILIHTIAAIPLVLFGPYLKITQIVSTFIFLLTITAVYLYFNLIFKNKRVAFLTAAIFSLFPVAFNYSRWLMLDVPVVGMLFIALYFLESSQNLTKKKQSILFFIFSGFLLLTKWTGALFLIIPAIFTLKEFIKNNKKTETIKNVIVGLIVFALITFPWYIPNLGSFLFQSGINVVGEQGAKPANVLSPDSLKLYLINFINFQTYSYVAVVFFISAIILLFKKFSHKWFIYLMIFGNYAIFTLISNKDSRYTMPFLPYVAFIIVCAFELLRSKKNLWKLFTWSFLLVLVVYYLILTLRPAVIEGLYSYVYIPIIGRADIIDVNDRLVAKYDPRNWQVSNMLMDVKSILHGEDGTVEVGIEDEHFNPATFQVYLHANQMQNKYKNLSISTPDIYYLRSHYSSDTFPNDGQIRDYLYGKKFVLLSPNDVGTEFLRNKQALIQLRYFVLHASLSWCDRYQSTQAVKNSTCFIKDSEVLQTASDIIINGDIKKGKESIAGFTEVFCKWGCTFKVIKDASSVLYPKVSLIKTYNLPDGKRVNLYELTW